MRSLVRVTFGALSIASLAATAGPGRPPAERVSAAPADILRMQGVEVRAHDDQSEIVLRFDGAPRFRSVLQRQPTVLVLDVPGALGDAADLPGTGTQVKHLRIEPRPEGDAPGLRLRVELADAATYDATALGQSLRIVIRAAAPASSVPAAQARTPDDVKALTSERRATRPRLAHLGTTGVRSEAHAASRSDALLLAQAGDAPSDEDAADDGAGGIEGSMGMSTGLGASGALAMTYIGFVQRDDESEIFARMSQRTTFEVRREGDNLMVLEIPRADIPLRNNKNHLDTTFFDSPVKMVTPTVVDGDESVIRIIVEVREDVPYESNLRGNDIVLRFKRRS